MRFFLVCLIFVGIAIDASAMVGTGGYSPFGPTTQKDGDGGRNTFSFHPTFVLNGAYPLFHGHVFAPQLGLVLHRDQYDENSKTTIFALMDVGYILHPLVLFRYGLGTFLTKVGGDGGTILLDNGNSSTAFAKPDHTVTSFNTTMNLGLEVAVNRNYAIQTEAFVFRMFNSEARAVSYLLTVNYYLD